MTATDDDQRGPSISSEDVKASQADKHVESRDKPQSRRKLPWLVLGTAVLTGLLAFLLGLGLGLGVHAFARPDQMHGKPSVATMPQVSYSIPLGTNQPPAGAPAAAGAVIPTPDQIRLDVITLSKKCFGSAGGLVTIRIDPTYIGSARLRGPFTVVYTITGDQGGPITDYFKVDSDGTTAHLSNEIIDTRYCYPTITATVTNVLPG